MLIFAIVVVLGLALAAVLYPLFQTPPAETPSEQGNVQAQELLVQRDNIYQAIRDLETDHQVGKLAEEDYQTFTAHLKGQAAEVLQQLGRLDRDGTAAPNRLDDALEEAIRSRRKAARPQESAPVALSENLEAQIEAARRKGKPASPVRRFCTACGERLPADAKFCPNCGAPVAESVNP